MYNNDGQISSEIRVQNLKIFHNKYIDNTGVAKAQDGQKNSYSTTFTLAEVQNLGCAPI